MFNAFSETTAMRINLRLVMKFYLNVPIYF
jgi:hypothetical protein